MKLHETINALIDYLEKRRDALVPEPIDDMGESLVDYEISGYDATLPPLPATEAVEYGDLPTETEKDEPITEPTEAEPEFAEAVADELPPIDEDGEIVEEDVIPELEKVEDAVSPDMKDMPDELLDIPKLDTGVDDRLPDEERPKETRLACDAEARTRINEIIEYLNLLNDEDIPGEVSAVEDEQPTVLDASDRKRFKPILLPGADDLPYWGKATAAWSSGNSVTVNPCDVDGNNVDTDTTVTVYAVSPTGKAITYMDVASADVLAYIPYGDNKGVLINVLHGGTDASKKAMYSTFEGLEAPQTDTWTRSSQGANDGVTMPLTTRVVYNDGGDEVLYGYYRTLTFDSVGLLKSISAETRYNVDTPGACP